MPRSIPNPLSWLPRKQKNKLRSVYRRSRQLVVRLFLSYSADSLLACLRALGVREGDTILLHSGFGPESGFRGSITDLTDLFLRAIGDTGNLAMVSLPYRSSSHDYLRKLRRFDVRKTPSAMGLVSEFFRRRPGVRRSLHPTHPMLAYGPRADWIVAGHEDCLDPCGPGTPFAKLLELRARVVFFNVPFATFTFFHFLEHHVQEHFEFPLYHEPPFDVPVVDDTGAERTVRTRVFSDEVIRRRRFPVLENELWRRGIIRQRRVGASRLLCVELDAVTECVDDMTARGVFFYDLA